MNKNTVSGRTSAIMKKYDIRPSKRFGQNFLIDEGILRGIVAASSVTKEDMVLEIGPGTGSMTALLCESAREVCAVEIDKKLIPALNDSLKEYENLTIINDDILKTDISAIAEGKNSGKPLKVVANLPYYITTPIIMGLLESKAPIASLTVMVQKEVADRMISPPGKKTYGALSLAVQYYTEAEKVLDVPPSSFIPNPKVSSAVMNLTLRETAPVAVKDEGLMFDIIRASFNQRRKTLVNGLKNAGLPGCSAE
ncbi:MAG: 16S rRNA (adenine(1518)-N(6)/adenine(1519)-N(6))-dimethyltransferase RsmA, partial [Lachnospiraceae bacterium]|nr:16S rRNA (adenine(1518)-N(6)/adenine(1519)-N(6))-dimethyltransferase RsmA [Lachnospiraceae bacterium]